MSSQAHESARLGFDLAPIGLVVTRHRNIDACNAAFAAMFGFPAGALEGKSLSILYPSAEEYQRVGERALAEMRETGRYQDERIMRRRNGEHFWCRVQGRSVEGGAPFAHAVWSMTDLSDMRPMVRLTRRERQVAMLLTEGRTSRDIAAVLGLSHRTVEAHRARLNEKMGVRNSLECVARLTGLPNPDGGPGNP